MLTQVPVSINRSARQVVLRHPNSFDCIVSRKRVVRVETGADGNPSEMGGSPTMGGMGVLRSEDEVEFEYDELGPAKLQFAGPGPFQAMDMIEHDNAALVERSREVLIESIADPGTPGYFQTDTGDLVSLTMELGVVISYEVATVQTPVLVPPYNRRLMLNPRDDLNYVEPFGA